MNGIILDAQERWNKNLRSTRKNEKLSQENLAALMREQGFTTCTQKSISRWEQVGRKPGYAFPSYDKMVGLAKCLQVDVPYLTGDMGGRTYDEQYIANSIGTDPSVVALIKELEQYASEKIDYEDDGEPENITLYHNADELALFILDFVGSEFISKYRDFVAAWMNITPQDDTSKAKNEEARYRKDLKVAKFELVDSFQAALCRQYPDPDSDAFLTEKGLECKRNEDLQRQQHKERLQKKIWKKLLEQGGTDSDQDKMRQISSALQPLVDASAKVSNYREERIEALRLRIAARARAAQGLS